MHFSQNIRKGVKRMVENQEHLATLPRMQTYTQTPYDHDQSSKISKNSKCLFPLEIFLRTINSH